jgi:hypothetical protein
LRPSPKSIIRLLRSTCACSSRRIFWRVRGTLAGCTFRNAIARPSGVARIQASVGWEAGAPVSGWVMRKSVTCCAPCHSAGSILPSTVMAFARPDSASRMARDRAATLGVGRMDDPCGRGAGGVWAAYS